MDVCASLLTGLSWSLASTFQLVIQATAAVSDVVMGQRGRSVDTLESEGQLEKSCLLLDQQTQKLFSTFLTLFDCRGQGITCTLKKMNEQTTD